MEDNRLDRLLEYTKFHIGIYLAAGGGILALLGSGDNNNFVRDLIGRPWGVAVGLVFMAIAGLGGGVIASATTKASAFDEVWNEAQGPLNLFKGETWASIEHIAFWIALGFISYSVLADREVWNWLIS